MKLTFLERLLAMGTLPEQGSVLLLRVRQTLIEKLGPTADEIVKWNVQQEGTRVTWDPQASGVEEEVALTESEVGILRDSLIKMDREQRLTPAHLSIYEKIVEKGA